MKVRVREGYESLRLTGLHAIDLSPAAVLFVRWSYGGGRGRCCRLRRLW